MAKLEEQKVNYLILDRRNNYDVDNFYDNKNLNAYNKIYDKARKEATYMIRVEKIYEYMKQNMRSTEGKKKMLISNKKYIKLGLRIDDITKYTIGWMKSIGHS